MSLISILIASLLGSPHCAGMCGGFVVFYSGNSTTPKISHISYNLGRFLTYITLGILAGYVGKTFNIAGQVAGFQNLAAILTGSLLIFWGLKALLIPNFSFFGEDLSSNIWRKIQTPLKALVKNETEISWNLRAFFIGLFTTFLPCGWLYTYVAIAAASADPINGALIMSVFWLGTLPIMLSIGAFSQQLTNLLGKRLPMLTAVLVIAAGIFAISGQIIPSMGHKHHHPKHHQH
ncbi:MAG: sulfite exporter TauE/SafE family protein [Deltaproteobacteria bacterium]|nr:sulfite exporter TauE/SafE family protein [Deltaproteobacteria bacterium]